MSEFKYKETEMVIEALNSKLFAKYNKSSYKIINTYFINVVIKYWIDNSVENLTEKTLMLFYKSLPERFKKSRGEFAVFLECLNDSGYGTDLTFFALKVINSNAKLSFDEIVKLKPRNRYFVSSKDNIGQSVLYIDTDVTEIRELIIEELLRSKSNAYKKAPFCEEFSKSLYPYSANSISDLSFDTFVAQIMYFKASINASYCWSFIREFYLVADTKYGLDIFEPYHISKNILHRTRFIKEISDGYNVIPHSKWEVYPKDDKWLLIHNESTNGSTKASNVTAFDFSKIDSNYRNFVKQYIWNVDLGYASLLLYFEHIQRFIAFVSEVENGSYNSIYCTERNLGKINSNKILAFKNDIMNKYGFCNTTTSIFVSIKNFLMYGSSLKEKPWSKSVCFAFDGATTIDVNSAKALSEDELQCLSSVINNNRNTIVDELCAILYYLLITTELRISNVLSLSRDCIQETMKNNQYVIKTRTKTSGKNTIDIPITIETKREIDKALVLTSGYISQTSEYLKNFLFLKCDARSNNLRLNLLTVANFNNYMDRCRKEANIDIKVTTATLRDTHITYAREFKLKHGLPDVAQIILSGHTNTVTDKDHYIDPKFSLQKMLEATNHIIIGNKSYYYWQCYFIRRNHIE